MREARLQASAAGRRFQLHARPDDTLSLRIDLPDPITDPEADDPQR